MEQKDVPRSCISMKGDDEEDDELFQRLPRERNWDGTSYLYQFQGFWCPSWAIHGVISFQQHFQACDTDVILASIPKSGTTWSKALVFAIVNRTRYGPNNNPLLTVNPHDLIPFFELDLYLDKNDLPNLEDQSDPPRIFSTHVPYASLPVSIIESGCRIVSVCRNPFDQLISHWHFLLKRSQENANPALPLEECFDMYCKGVNGFGPFWEHVLGYWKASLENPNKVLFLKYEDLKVDASFEHLKKLAEFLGFPFSAEEERDGVIQQVSSLCSFQNLKDLQVNKTGKLNGSGFQKSSLFRKGEVGDWANYLSPSMAQRLKNLVEEKLAGSGLSFKASL